MMNTPKNLQTKIFTECTLDEAATHLHQ